MSPMDIDIIPIKVEPGEADTRESEDIKNLKPLYNIAMAGNLYSCLCDPTKTYKTRGGYEKHMRQFHKEELEDLAVR